MDYINSGWEFQKLYQTDIDKLCSMEDISFDKAVFEQVDLPHTWYSEEEPYKGTVVYRKKVMIDYKEGNQVFLNFQAADRWCKVFVNKYYVGEHKGGYSAFTFPITQYCRQGEENELDIFLDNCSWEEISPLTGDFTVFGGLYRGINLIITENVCFDRSYYGTNGLIVRTKVLENGTGEIFIEPHLYNAERKNIQIDYQVLSPNQEIAACKTEWGENVCRIEIPTPVLWNGLKKGALYCLHAELKIEGRQVDSTHITLGFRSISIDGEKGFFLNGENIKINGVAKHQDYDSVFNATKQEHWNQDICDILEIGANSVRLSHYQHPQEMYCLCDKYGLIVWAEIPMLKMTENEALLENACSQLKELILQNIHHPSICFWGIQNEIAMFGENQGMYEKVKRLADLAKQLDPSRISSCANLFCVKNDSMLNTFTEAVGYNIYFGWYYGEMKDSETFVEKFHEDNPHIPLGITEYGVDCNLAFHSQDPKVKDYSEEFQALYHETVYPMFKSKPYIWGTYVWNLYDFSSEIRDEGGLKHKNGKGLITFDRKIKKDAYYYYMAQWSSKPFVKIAQSRFVKREQPEICITVYSNQKEVDLYVNQNCYKGFSESGVFHFHKIALGQGENRVKAVSGEWEDEAMFCGVTEKELSYVYVDSNPGLNVKNWFTDVVEEERMFPKGMFSIRESCKDLLESKQAMAVIEEFSAQLAKQMRERQGMMPLERILSYMKKEVTDEQCRELNGKLIQIAKGKE